jgi:TPR repeat protein
VAVATTPQGASNAGDEADHDDGAEPTEDGDETETASQTTEEEPPPSKRRARRLPEYLRPTPAEQNFGLLPTPTAQPVRSSNDFKRAERGCINKQADQCVRVAEAYASGNPVPEDQLRAGKFRARALKLYMDGCTKKQDPDACYRLARRAHDGDGIRKDPRNAHELLKRVKVLCQYRDAEVCEKLEKN